MTRALLDVNVLIALLDADHVHHAAASTWLSMELSEGWASCALTENGCVRIMSQPRYPSALPPQVVAERLAQACASDAHEFWECKISLLDSARVDTTRLHRASQITDVYLLALAVEHSGRLATLDGNIDVTVVKNATPEHLLLIG